VGKGLPIAYALDGYPIFGLVEPDGSFPGTLDECHGHESAGIGYHYHASTKYPYVNGGFHGEVVEREGQVDPQPRAGAIRSAGVPLRGAKITGFTTTQDGKSHNLTYTVGGKASSITYDDVGGGAWKFQFVSQDGARQEQTYPNAGRGNGGPPARNGDTPPPGRPREEGNRREGPPDRERAGRGPQGAPSPFGPDAMKKPSTTFVLSSPEIGSDGTLPVDYSGDGSGSTLPLVWKGAPAGTRSFALIMDHLAPGNEMKWYWTMWDIPATTTSLPKNVRDVGKVGTGFKGKLGYEPPHSQGPGAKTYVLTVYALSSPLSIAQAPAEVNRDVLLAAMKDKVLASASLNAVYTRGGNASSDDRRPARREGESEAPFK
ncbi:MAG TPA: YbhB/YbcL family Raf kinase inhibitor-like protein, partial [Verrucomicrobiaceae bacterium]